MTILDKIKNKTIYSNKYKTDSEAVVIACYFNPKNNPYRLKAFNIFYDSIKHLNHRIIECVIGDSKPQLEENENIKRITTPSLLWHKESLLNMIISELPESFKYVFWVDTDVIFTNKNWLVDGVTELKINDVIQPFEYCVHLEKDELKPSFPYHSFKRTVNENNEKGVIPTMWRSFCANYVKHIDLANDLDYNKHGHVGFAWGAKRSVLDRIKLYDRALIGGADHIIAHAAVGQINHNCITKSFTENINEVNAWSERFYRIVNGRVGYVSGDLFHIWHGDITKRQYLKRIQDFTPKIKEISKKDKNGLHVTDDDTYVNQYFDNREVKDDGFVDSLVAGYLTNSTIMGTMMGGNITGAMLGDALNSSEDNNTQNTHNNHNSNNTTDSNYFDTNTSSENFS